MTKQFCVDCGIRLPGIIEKSFHGGNDYEYQDGIVCEYCHKIRQQYREKRKDKVLGEKK